MAPRLLVMEGGIPWVLGGCVGSSTMMEEEEEDGEEDDKEDGGPMAGSYVQTDLELGPKKWMHRLVGGGLDEHFCRDRDC